MKYLASADNLFIATLWQQMLEDAGIPCQLRNRFASGAVGELPVDQALPQIWLVDERNLERAHKLLAELRRPAWQPPWICPGCGERIEGQFQACWQCGHERAP